MKKLTAAILALSMCFGMVGTGFAQESSSKSKSDKKITILGTSDIHGVFVPWDYASDTEDKSGSLSQITKIIKDTKKENPNTIVVDAGDLIQGNFVETFKNEEKSPMVQGLNEAKYDLWVPGNHEFNFGMDVLKKNIDQFKGTTLAGNLYNKKDNSRYLPAYKIIEKDGVKIGFIGMTTPLISQFEAGTDHLDGLDVKMPVEETKKVIKELDGKVDVIVGIMHMGENNENGIAGTGVTDIAKACPEIDVILAGHMHVKIDKKEIGTTIVTEPYKYGKAVSRIDLEFATKDGKNVLVSKESKALDVSKTESDKDMEKLYAPYHEKLRKDANEVIGKVVGGDMVPKAGILPNLPVVQIQDTPLATFFQEVCQYYSKADVIALQIDTDNAKMDQGEIKKKDIANNYRYAGGEVSVYEFTGKDLKDYMEWSAAYFDKYEKNDTTIKFNKERRAEKYSTNDFFSGVTYKIDLTKEVGNRIVDLKFADGKEVKADSKFKIGMNSYRLERLVKKGGALEGRTFKKIWSSEEEFNGEAGTIRNLAIKYIKEVKKGVIEAKNDNNWELISPIIKK